jgi:hypothetical protein
MREIGRCPACEGWVEVFSQATTTERARICCPHCETAFRLDDLIAVDIRPAIPLPPDPSARHALESPSPATVDDDDLIMAPLDHESHRMERGVTDPPLERRAESPTEAPSDYLAPQSPDNIRQPLNWPAADPPYSIDPSAARPSAARPSAARRDFRRSDAESYDEPVLERPGMAMENRVESAPRVIVEPTSSDTDAIVPSVMARETTRRSRREKHLGWELFKVIAGGIAGLMLAQLILWWLPGSMRRDPFGVAPHLPKWLHFVMPAELQAELVPPAALPPSREFIPLEPAIPADASPEANPFADEPTPTSSTPPTQPRTPNPPPANTLTRNAAEATADDANVVETASARDELGDEETWTRLSEREVQEIAAVTGLMESSDDAAPVEPTTRPDRAADADAPLADQPPTPAQTAPAGFDMPMDSSADVQDNTGPDVGSPEMATLQDPKYDGAELQRSLARAVSAMDHLTNQAGKEREVRAEAARQFYQRLAEVAQIVSFVHSDDPDFGQRMNATEALLGRVANDASMRNLVRRTAGGWLNYPARTSDGIAAVATVSRIEPLGNQYEVYLESSDAAAYELRMISRSQPSLDARCPYAVGDTLLLLGSILSHPSHRFPDYPDTGPVILHGLHVRLSP